MASTALKRKPKCRRRSHKSRERIFIWAMLALPLLQFLIFTVYVNIDSVLMAFQQVDMQNGKVVWTFANFQRFFSELVQLPQIRTAMLNSLYAGLNDLLLMLISLFFAYLFYKKVPGRRFYRIIFFLPSIISIVIYAMVYMYMFDMDLGPVNIVLKAFGVQQMDLPTWFGDSKLAFLLVLFYCLWVGTGYNILIFSSAIDNIQPSLMEYSRLEGVGMFREFFTIVIPMIWPTLAVSILGSVTTMFTLFIQVDLLTGGGPGYSSQTIAYLVNSTIKSSSANSEWGACLGIMFTIIATPLIIMVKKLCDKISEKFGF